MPAPFPIHRHSHIHNKQIPPYIHKHAHTSPYTHTHTHTHTHMSCVPPNEGVKPILKPSLPLNSIILGFSVFMMLQIFKFSELLSTNSTYYWLLVELLVNLLLSHFFSVSFFFCLISFLYLCITKFLLFLNHQLQHWHYQPAFGLISISPQYSALSHSVLKLLLCAHSCWLIGNLLTVMPNRSLLPPILS